LEKAEEERDNYKKKYLDLQEAYAKLKEDFIILENRSHEMANKYD
jgi:predicted  nucleic acid-binding Zn-ribbon protein